MVTANEATAKFAKDNGLDNIYRVHDEPNQSKVNRANEFFELLGIEFDGDLSAQGTRNLIDIIRDTDKEEVINKFLIKMQSRAIYSDHLYSDKKADQESDFDWLGERISHYALQSPHYSHTTSPIRRVPDYITQYNILASIHDTTPISAERIQEIVENSNERQLDVDQAEKDFEDISSVLYCEKHIGEKMSGRITKLRTTTVDEGYDEDILVIVKNEERGISVEIPLREVIGRNAGDCFLSREHCAVYDRNGNILLTLCKPVDFIIDSADRKSMVVVGKTNKLLVSEAESRHNQNHKMQTRQITPSMVGQYHSKQKQKRGNRLNSKKSHDRYHIDDEDGSQR